VMDHGRVGPPGVFGGEAGLPNQIEIIQGGKRSTPPHLSKDQDVVLREGDSICVRTPGGGGFGNPSTRSADLVRRDLLRGYYDDAAVKQRFGADLPEAENAKPAPRRAAR
jgi:N-methylhydantoinase B